MTTDDQQSSTGQRSVDTETTVPAAAPTDTGAGSTPTKRLQKPGWATIVASVAALLSAITGLVTVLPPVLNAFKSETPVIKPDEPDGSSDGDAIGNSNGPAGTDSEHPNAIWAMIAMASGGVAVGLFIMSFRNILQERDRAILDLEEARSSGSNLMETVDTTTIKLNELKDLSASLAAKVEHSKDNRIRMIQSAEYGKILNELITKYKNGHLLLFNIEMNSFTDDQIFAHLWEPLASRPEIQSVQLALPAEKMRRWERLVTGVRSEFFNRPEIGQKFFAYQYQPPDGEREDRIAFALYKRDSDPDHHNWGALFLLNRPFITTMRNGSKNYLHILEYKGQQDGLDRLASLWNKSYDAAWADSAASIQKFHERRSTPPDLSTFLDEHRCDPSRAAQFNLVVNTRRIVDPSAMQPSPTELLRLAPDKSGRHEFTMTYRRDPQMDGPTEQIKGWISNLKALDHQQSPMPCLIWASGFGDGRIPKTARAVSRELRKRGIRFAEVLFTKSGDVTDTTCTRIGEDIKAIVDYVSGVPEIDRTRICIAGISLSGYMTAKIAQTDKRINSAVLIAPPFDIVEMLDDFRRHYLRNDPTIDHVPLFTDFLKARPSLRIADWDMNARYCNYFGQTVSCSHLIDIVMKGRREFGRSQFLDAISEMTLDGRRVALFYGRNDPIVDPGQNIPRLHAALDSNKIEREFLKLHEIPVAHFYPPMKMQDDDEFADDDTANNTQMYPFKESSPVHAGNGRRDVRQFVHGVADEVCSCLKILIEDQTHVDGDGAVINVRTGSARGSGESTTRPSSSRMNN